MLQNILDSLQSLLSVTGILYIVLGSLVGMVFGALPGLAGGTIMVMLLPITYKMDPVLVLALFVAIHIGSTSGGCIGSILLGIPGTSSSMATVWDGYEFTKLGDPVRPLSVAVVCNFIGTIPSILIAMFACRVLAEWGVKMGPWEYTSMCVCALVMVIGLSNGNLVKGFAAVGLALLIASVGTDAITGRARLAFGNLFLMDGFNIINIMLGMFAAKIILLEYAHRTKVKDASNIKVRGFKWPGKDLKDNLPNLIRSFITGAFIGFLPGLGAPTSTVLAYSNERMLDKKNKDLWGHGHIGGVIAPEVANNAGIGGAMIPAIALGIPGDAIMVQFLAVMSIHGVETGPMVMRTNPEMVYMLYTAAMVAAVLVLLYETVGMPLFPKFISMPYYFLYPAILVISFVGAYMTAGNMLGVLVTFCACILGLLMDYFDVPTTPFVMAYILAPILEKNIRQGLNYSINGAMDFITRPVSAIFLLVAVAVLVLNVVWPAIKAMRDKKKEAQS